MNVVTVQLIFVMLIATGCIRLNAEFQDLRNPNPNNYRGLPLSLVLAQYSRTPASAGVIFFQRLPSIRAIPVYHFATRPSVHQSIPARYPTMPVTSASESAAPVVANA